MTTAHSIEEILVQPFTEGHAEALLALLVSLDARLRAPDEHTAVLRTKAWAKLLAEVDPAFAVRFVEHSYQEIRESAITPAEILQAWRSRVREEAEESGSALFGPDEYAAPRGWEPAMVDWIRDVLAAYARGESADTVPRPASIRRQLTPAQDAWERRCPYHRMCACDHLKCRDGWLDEERMEPGPFGLYPKALRCPHCKDALDIAVDQGIAKRPTDRPRRRS